MRVLGGGVLGKGMVVAWEVHRGGGSPGGGAALGAEALVGPPQGLWLPGNVWYGRSVLNSSPLPGRGPLLPCLGGLLAVLSVGGGAAFLRGHFRCDLLDGRYPLLQPLHGGAAGEEVPASPPVAAESLWHACATTCMCYSQGHLHVLQPGPSACATAMATCMCYSQGHLHVLQPGPSAFAAFASAWSYTKRNIKSKKSRLPTAPPPTHITPHPAVPRTT